MKTNVRNLFFAALLLLAGCASRQLPLQNLNWSAPSHNPTILKVVSTEHRVEDRTKFTHEIFLGTQRFDTLRSLERHLRTLPKGTEIEYDLSCLAIPDRPLAQAEDLDKFARYCESNGIVLLMTHGTHQGRVYRLPKGGEKLPNNHHRENLR